MRNLTIKLFCLFFLLGVVGIAQSSNKVKIEKSYSASNLCLRGKVTKVEFVRENNHSIVFNSKLDLEFINNSDKPIILLKREFWLGAKTIARSSEEANTNKYLYSSGGWEAVSDAPKLAELSQQLNQPSPPSDLTQTLLPGESMSYQTNATLYIEKKGSFDKTSQSWDVIKQTSPVWLQVTFEIWSKNIGRRIEPEFGKTLQKRWKQFGELQLNNITSEPMSLTFADFK